MQKKQTAKDKLIDAAWQLFMENGYEQTTVNQIISVSHTSRGAFYHHFKGKEDLLFCLAYFFDNDYTQWEQSLEDNMSALDKLYAFDAYVLKNLEESPYKSFLASLYGLQVMTDSTRHILNPQRKYYQFITHLIKEGMEQGEIKSPLSAQDLTSWYADIERGCTYNWCLASERHSLTQHGQRMMKIFLDSLRP